MSDVYGVTRNDLFKITKDLRVIRALENLFKNVPANFVTNNNEALNANAKAAQAVGMAVNNDRRVRGGNVLTWLSM